MNAKKEVPMIRIGMLTSGGDCQALNAAMRGVAKGLFNAGKEVELFGFLDGYKVESTRCSRRQISLES